MSEFDVSSSLNVPATSLPGKNTPNVNSQHNHRSFARNSFKRLGTFMGKRPSFWDVGSEFSLVNRYISSFKILNIILCAVVCILIVDMNTFFILYSTSKSNHCIVCNRYFISMQDVSSYEQQHNVNRFELHIMPTQQNA